MCGILFANTDNNLELLKNSLSKSAHRGPDNTKYVVYNKCFFGFHRLAIHGLDEIGDQPLQKLGRILICNGEIYNYKTLSIAFSFSHDDYANKSDCEIILDLLINRTISIFQICNMLDGVFAFVTMDARNQVCAARDPIGVRPLFYGYTENKEIVFGSEMKNLYDICDHSTIKEFPPGSYYCDGGFFKYTDINTVSKSIQCDLTTLRNLLVAAVEKRLSSERPVGFFLSGGLDSSLIASIGSQILKTQISTFSIGIGDSPDLKNAQKVAEYLGSKHTEIKFTISEAMEVLEDVIYQLETYDCTTIRASVPMYLLSKYVKENTDIKVILSGEGADELFGGYLYFHDAPDVLEFQKETINLLKNVHKFDVLRADRCTAGNGLELRVPFFDKSFREYVVSMHPKFKKTSAEKLILRKAFDLDYLPKSVLYRQKNGMSDAVGYSWVDHIRSYAESTISSEEFINEKNMYLHNSPVSKEELMYRRIYEKFYKNVDLIPHIWRPKYTDILDPSAKMLSRFTDFTQQDEPKES